MAAKQPLLLLDTNILLDYFDCSRPGSADAVALVRYALDAGIGLLVAPTSCKDFYYQTAYAVKRDVRAAGKGVTPEIAAAAEEFSWGCLQSLLDIVTVLSLGDIDVHMSRSIHSLHRDFEDDLIVAAAMRCGATYLVTGDKRLAAKSPVATLNAGEALLMLKGRTV